MTAEDAYYWLAGDNQSFPVHVLASILAVSVAEAAESGDPLHTAAGYDGAPALLLQWFPQAGRLLADPGRIVRSEGETALLQLLIRGSSTGSELEVLLAGMIARRAERPNHLWQDLGLRNRGELSRLMNDYFGPLARRNTSDMKWKKFFFRIICRDCDYALCTAPSCGECSDFDNCFNEETGESLLAHNRRAAERAV